MNKFLNSKGFDVLLERFSNRNEWVSFETITNYLYGLGRVLKDEYRISKEGSDKQKCFVCNRTKDDDKLKKIDKYEPFITTVNPKRKGKGSQVRP